MIDVILVSHDSSKQYVTLGGIPREGDLVECTVQPFDGSTPVNTDICVDRTLFVPNSKPYVLLKSHGYKLCSEYMTA